jgi:hypothetical protein
VFLPNPNEGFFDGEIIEEEEAPEAPADTPTEAPKD